jgi:transposase-like protein
MNTGRPSPMRSPRVQQRAIELLGEGLSMPAVARQLGVHKNTLQSWVQRYEQEEGPIDGRHRVGEVPVGTFDGTRCPRCWLCNPHECLPVGPPR